MVLEMSQIIRIRRMKRKEMSDYEWRADAVEGTWFFHRRDKWS